MSLYLSHWLYIYRANEDQALDIILDAIHGDNVERRAVVSAGKYDCTCPHIAQIVVF